MQVLQKLSKEQRKILLFGSIALVIIGVFILIVYIPRVKKLSDLRKEYNVLDTDVKKIQEDFHLSADVSSWLVYLNRMDQKYSYYKKAFFLPEEELVKVLSSAAYKNKLQWISFTPKDEVILTNDKEQPITIGGRFCISKNVAFEVNGTYEDIGNYIKELEGKFPAILVIDNLTLTKPEEEGISLKANFVVTIYLVQQ